VLSARAGKVKLHGRVKGAHSGRVVLRVRHTRRGSKAAAFDSSVARASVVKTMDVRRDGRFRFTLKLHGQGRWRVRAVYVGDSDAYPSRSRLLKFRV
jgi:hypothetical protein